MLARIESGCGVGKLTIALDMDGVMADTLPWLLLLLKRYHGEHLTVNDITDWDISKACKNTSMAEVDKFFHQNGFFRHLPVMEGAKQIVGILLGQGHDVIIVTSTKYGHTDKLAWLADEFPGVEQNNVYFASRKWRVQADVFIDDNVENLEQYKQHNPKALVICFDAAYNGKWRGLRAKSWSEVLTILQGAAQVQEEPRKGRPNE